MAPGETLGVDSDLRMLLEHCQEGFVPVIPLLSRCPKSRLYRRLRRALRDGLIVKGAAGRYKTTERGVAILETPESGIPVPGDDVLVEAIPHLAIIGKISRVHQAVAELVAAAAVARTFALRDAHHPSFVVMGERLRFKTWLARACCSILGADDRLAVLHPAAETSGSMFKRRGSKGQVVSERRLLTESRIFAIDEFQRAQTKLRDIMVLVMHGQLSVPFENETATIRAVPMVVLNPLAESGSLSERTGLDEALLRRSVVVDLAKVTIPEAVLPHGDAMLDELRRLPPIVLTAPGDASDPPVDRLRDVLARSLASADLMADVDVGLVGLLAIGMRAFLPPEEALKRTVHDYLLLLSTTGRTSDQWGENLKLLDAPKSGLAALEQPKREPNPLSWNDNLRKLAQALDAAGIGPGESLSLLGGLKFLNALAGEAGVPPKQALRHGIDWVRERVALEGALDGALRAARRTSHLPGDKAVELMVSVIREVLLERETEARRVAGLGGGENAE